MTVRAFERRRAWAARTAIICPGAAERNSDLRPMPERPLDPPNGTPDARGPARRPAVDPGV